MQNVTYNLRIMCIYSNEAEQYKKVWIKERKGPSASINLRHNLIVAKVVKPFILLVLLSIY